jgi:ABC-type lipoprotein export system ATPase subunit
MALRNNNLGTSLWQVGDLAGARAEFERALAIDEAVLGADHPTVANDRRKLDQIVQQLQANSAR